jgi:Arc/MetJ-type ribon-helix-helix transcriptional regulator
MHVVASPIPTRFTDDEVALIDDLIAAGVGSTRSDVIRRGLHNLADAVRRAGIGESIAASYRNLPQTEADDALAAATAQALIDAEPW